jgi:hypothetical protein
VTPITKLRVRRFGSGEVHQDNVDHRFRTSSWLPSGQVGLDSNNQKGFEDIAETEGDLIDRMAKRHSVSPAFSAGRAGCPSPRGRADVQFSHADFGGMSQWSPGMSMVGDMFNTQLKAKLDALCTDIAAHLDVSETGGGVRPDGDEVSYRSPTRSDDWWPAGLGRPAAVGAQNDLRYAVFPETRRLVIDDQGAVSVYDTGSHRIFGRRAGPKRRSDAHLH